MAEFKVVHRDELHRSGRWELVRRSLLIASAPTTSGFVPSDWN